MRIALPNLFGGLMTTLKKQLNIRLSKDVRIKLIAIAKAWNQPMTAVIDALIRAYR